MDSFAHSDRSEWRGDLFRSDLTQVTPRLPGELRLERPTPHTITVFYGDGDAWVDDRKPVRLRTYALLPDLSPDALSALLTHRLQGKLQVKRGADDGSVEHIEMESQDADLPELPAELHLDERRLTPHSVRVAVREHYAIGPLFGRPESEHERLTVDVERHLFRLADRPQPTYLGDLGPRLEIKAPSREECDTVATDVGVAGLARHLPYRSLELVFQDLLRDAIATARDGDVPEMEGKLELVDAAGAERAADGLVAWASALPGARLLLPAPARIVRVRRYHVCRHAQDERQWTVVETMAGRLSVKIKGGAREEGGALVRDTVASHDTDKSGMRTGLESFLAEHDLEAVNRFDKHQVQVPFVLADGTAFCVKIDDCIDPHGHRLVQCELEAIGSLGGHLDVGAIAEHLGELSASLAAGGLGVELRPTLEAKHDVFSRCADVPVPAAA
jgi:hypothetical protein